MTGKSTVGKCRNDELRTSLGILRTNFIKTKKGKREEVWLSISLTNRRGSLEEIAWRLIQDFEVVKQVSGYFYIVKLWASALGSL